MFQPGIPALDFSRSPGPDSAAAAEALPLELEENDALGDKEPLWLPLAEAEALREAQLALKLALPEALKVADTQAVVDGDAEPLPAPLAVPAGEREGEGLGEDVG